MRRKIFFLTILALILCIVLIASVLKSIFGTFKQKPKAIKNYAVYYGNFTENLTKFDLVIVSPLYSPEQLELLRTKNVIVVGYFSLTTIGGWEPWAPNVTEDMIVGYDPDWGEYIVNVSDPKWKDIVIQTVEWMLSKGYFGVFFDNLDFAEEYPSFNKSIISIIREVRQRFEGVIIAQNRGFCLLNYTCQYIDYLLFEDFGSLYDFELGKYRKFNEEEMAWLRKTAEWVRGLSEKYGFTVLALGYANMSDSEQLSEIEAFTNSLAEEYGFIPYVADVNLDRLNMDYSNYGE